MILYIWSNIETMAASSVGINSKGNVLIRLTKLLTIPCELIRDLISSPLDFIQLKNIFKNSFLRKSVVLSVSLKSIRYSV